MKLYHENYADLNQFSHTDLSYISHDQKLKEFYAYEPSKDSIKDVVQGRKSFPVDRKLLLDVIKRQYAELDLKVPVADTMILDENTFTITTSHQPTLFTGPLFHIYKIASVIHLAKELNETSKGHHFIPVFIMSGEDHDWQEVNHFNVFGRRYEWERSASGPCGRLSTSGLDILISTIDELFKNSPFGKDVHELLSNCLSKAVNYGHFHRLLVASLFAEFDLIVLNLDDLKLKEAFIPLMEREIREHFSHQYVTDTQAKLTHKGFKIQAFCREVNLFYMTDETRERLDPVEGGVIRIGSGIKYNQEEILHELYSHPDRFSPNVIMRPLYQEFILPNIAYVGGGGEIAYWLERKTQFNAAGVHYPMLIRRNSLLIIDKSTSNQLKKLGLESKEMFHSLDALNRSYLNKHSKSELNYDKEKQKISEAYRDLADKAEKLDPTLSKAILAEESKQIKLFEHLGSRLLRTEKHLHDTQLKKIQRIKEKLFPAGGLQERHENFLSFYANEGPQWISEMVSICDPWIEKFILVESAE